LFIFYCTFFLEFKPSFDNDAILVLITLITPKCSEWCIQFTYKTDMPLTEMYIQAKIHKFSVYIVPLCIFYSLFFPERAIVTASLNDISFGNLQFHYELNFLWITNFCITLFVQVSWINKIIIYNINKYYITALVFIGA